MSDRLLQTNDRLHMIASHIHTLCSCIPVHMSIRQVSLLQRAEKVMIDHVLTWSRIKQSYFSIENAIYCAGEHSNSTCTSMYLQCHNTVELAIPL